MNFLGIPASYFLSSLCGNSSYLPFFHTNVISKSLLPFGTLPALTIIGLFCFYITIWTLVSDFFFFKACFLSFPTRKRSLGTAYALPVLRYCCSPGLSDGLRPTPHGSSSCLSKGQGRIPGCVARAVSHGAAFKGILCLVYCSSLAVPEFIIIRTGGPTVSFFTGPRLSPRSFCDLPTHVAPKAKLCRPDRGAYARVTSHASFSFNTHLQISKSYLLCP